jgi:hypothetical protein
MKILLLSTLFVGCSLANGQASSVFDPRGFLKLVDRPPDATPVEAPIFRIHPLDGGFEIEAQPDRGGEFTLNEVRPGRYSLTFPMPGRIESFTNGSRELAPDGFELTSAAAGPLVLVIGMKSADVSVKVHDLPAGHDDVVALLAPADTRLTLRESCYVQRLSGSQTTFSFVPPGRYRIFILDAQFQRDFSAYAPRLHVSGEQSIAGRSSRQRADRSYGGLLG